MTGGRSGVWGWTQVSSSCFWNMLVLALFFPIDWYLQKGMLDLASLKGGYRKPMKVLWRYRSRNTFKVFCSFRLQGLTECSLPVRKCQFRAYSFFCSFKFWKGFLYVILDAGLASASHCRPEAVGNWGISGASVPSPGSHRDDKLSKPCTRHPRPHSPYTLNHDP